MQKLVVLCGPSCIGKSPLFAALRRFYPALAKTLKPLVLYNDRAARPGEVDGVDYHFRPRGEIEALRENPDYLVIEVRADLQALEIGSIQRIIDGGFVAFFEGNPAIPAKLHDAGVLAQFETLSVFLSPLSHDEIVCLKGPEQRVDLATFVTDIQRRKLLHRTKRQKVNLSQVDLEDIERRAASAIVEMRAAAAFDHVIPLYDGEGNDNWDAFYYPIGSARAALDAFAGLLRGNSPAIVEHWEDGLIP
jgi:guanylate kinase